MASKKKQLPADVVQNVQTLLMEKERIPGSQLRNLYFKRFGSEIPKGKVKKYVDEAGGKTESLKGGHVNFYWPGNERTEDNATSNSAAASRPQSTQDTPAVEEPWRAVDFRNSEFKGFLTSKMDAAARNQEDARRLPALVGEKDAAGAAFLGCVDDGDDEDEDEDSAEVYLNTDSPFTLLAVGLPGGGKSHTINGILEACVLPNFCVQKPMAALVCHFDKTDGHNTLCETVGLLKAVPDSPNPETHLQPRQLVVLCSPSNLEKRRQQYTEFDPSIQVLPLKFQWEELRADEICKLMRLSTDASQLYVSVMFQKLRDHYQAGQIPPLDEFVKEMLAECSTSQRGPAQQRLDLLKSFTSSSTDHGNDLPRIADLVSPGNVIIADLSDPFLSSEGANGIFQVLLGQFQKSTTSDVGKVVVFDEAHRYMGSSGGLAEEITNCARMLRHDGMRLLVSTQSPLVIPEELLELTTVLVAHRYQSRDCHEYLCRKLRFKDESFNQIGRLETGHALLYSMSSSFKHDCMQIQIRPRITRDLGGTRCNDDATGAASSIATVVADENSCGSASSGDAAE